MLTRKKLFAFMCVSFVCLLVIFQNCSPLNVSFNSLNPEKPLASLGAEFGNGSGYDGKPEGVYYRYVPDFTCETQESPAAVLTINSETDIHYRENSQFKCGAIDGSLAPILVTRSRLQNEVVSYQAIPFERKISPPPTIPDNLLEAWCRDLSQDSLFEVHSRYDRVTQRAVARTYSGTQQNGIMSVAQSADNSVARLVGPTRVLLRNDTFVLSIERARFSSVPGEFIGDYQNLSDGRKRELSCALGGALDPRVWPTKVLFDLPPIIHANSLRPSYKLSPDRESLTVLSSLMPRIPGASRPPAPFTLFSWKNGVWLPLSSLSTGSLGVITFQLANDSQNLVVLADPAPHVSEQLFHVARDGRGSPTLLSSPGVILADSPQEDFFVDDRSSSVYYRDSERDPNAQPGDRPRRTLWRASFSGEAPIRLFDLSVNDESYVRTFAVHPNIGKIVFSLIPSTLLNTRSHFTMNVDGTAVTKWPEVTQTNASPTIDRFSSLYPSGRWTERFTTWQTTTGEESQRSTLIDLQTGLGLNVCDQDTNLVGAIVSAPQSIASDWLAISCKNLANTIVSSRLQQMTTGVTFDLPVRGIKFFSQDSLRFWYIQDDAATLSTRNRLMQINLETSVAREVCPQSEGRWLNATSPSSQGEPSLGLHWNTTGQSMDVFQISDDGSCRQVNRVTIPFSYVNFASVKVSPDFTSALVSPDAPGSLSILVFVPLNGTPPLQINSPRNRAAKLLSMDFLGNAGEVVYLSDDAWPGEYAIYTWKKPTTPETVQ